MNKRRYLIIVGIVVAVVVVAVLLNTMLVNSRPVITRLAAEPEGLLPLGSCQIVCNATAPHGDKLSYNWSASEGAITGEGATVTWTAPASAGSYNVTVTVIDSHGGNATKQITIPVRANSPPIITSLIANAAWTGPSGSLQVTCNASDADDDALSYGWTTDGGAISGTGSTVNWSAPRGVGAYNVTIVVKDGYGGKATRFLTLCVDLGTPPTIEKLVITPEAHIFLRQSYQPGCNFDVWKKQKYNIECIASGTGELFYDWSSTDGDVSGTGSNITWTAPNKQSTSTLSVEVAVTAIVSDDAGNGIARSMVFYVPTCSCGSWALESGEISF